MPKHILTWYSDDRRKLSIKSAASARSPKCWQERRAEKEIILSYHALASLLKIVALALIILIK